MTTLVLGKGPASNHFSFIQLIRPDLKTIAQEKFSLENTIVHKKFIETQEGSCLCLNEM